MDHNSFDYELDMILPIKDFFRRHTGYKEAETSEVEIPMAYFDAPKCILEYVDSLRGTQDAKKSSSCFCGEREDIKEGN